MPFTSLLRGAALGAVASFAFASAVAAAPDVGAPAPDFTVQDSTGQTHSLSDFEGRTVVLEWTNHECPFVVKHYDAGNMQSLQKKVVEEGDVWLQVISSAPGEQGAVDGDKAASLNEERNATPTAVLFDPTGEMGKAYGARTTPHMYVIDPEGTLVYMGGIDSIPSSNPADIPSATNYVREALQALANGSEVPNPVTRAYGCTIKYAS